MNAREKIDTLKNIVELMESMIDLSENNKHVTSDKKAFENHPEIKEYNEMIKWAFNEQEFTNNEQVMETWEKLHPDLPIHFKLQGEFLPTALIAFQIHKYWVKRKK